MPVHNFWDWTYPESAQAYLPSNLNKAISICIPRNCAPYSPMYLLLLRAAEIVCDSTNTGILYQHPTQQPHCFSSLLVRHRYRCIRCKNKQKFTKYCLFTAFILHQIRCAKFFKNSENMIDSNLISWTSLPLSYAFNSAACRFSQIKLFGLGTRNPFISAVLCHKESHLSPLLKGVF